MVWFIQPSEIADSAGKGTGRWRMTATSDEGGGGPFGDTSHDHATAEEAEACDQCDEYVNRWAGFPSRKQQAERRRAHPDRVRMMEDALRAIAMMDVFTREGEKPPHEVMRDLAKTALIGIPAGSGPGHSHLG